MEIIYQKREKLRNENRTFRFLVEVREFSKFEISQYLNISIPTVTKILERFLTSKLIYETGTNSGKLGRKAVKYQFNPNAYFSIGIKVEMNHISMVLINLDGKILKQTVVKEEFINSENFVFLVINELKKFLWEFDKKEFIKGIGIVLPGVVDPENNMIKLGGNFTLLNQDMKEIEEEFGLPIFLENEANAGAIGEYIVNHSGLQTKKNILFISIDTGIGSGIIVEDQLYRGKGNKSGEIGHIPIIPNGDKCVCGSEGCLEQYCSNLALMKEFEKEFQCEIKEYEDIFQKKFIETEKGKKILERYTWILALGIKTALMMLNSDKIIIGGKISDYKEYFEPLLKEIIFSNNIFSKDTDILEFSSLSDNANLLGAAFIPLGEFYKTYNEDV